MREKPVQYVKGVGPARAEKLARLHIHTVKDLIEYYPRDWSDRRFCTPINLIQPGASYTVRGVIRWQNVKSISSRLAVFHVFIVDKTGMLDAIWIRSLSRRYDVFAPLIKRCQQGREIIVFGYADLFNRSLQITVEDYEVLEKTGEPHSVFNRIVPIYQLTEGISQSCMRTIVQHALHAAGAGGEEVLPSALIAKRALLKHGDAVSEIHFPESLESKETARRSLAFEEFFFIELAMALQRHHHDRTSKEYTYEIKKTLLSPFRQNLKFQFTGAQKRVIREIFSDMRSNRRMNRLLQGDVGSGKTVVALSAMLLAIENGYQAAFMAPTEILAEQHYYTVRNLYRGLPVTVALMKGSMQKKERERLREGLSQGSIHLIVGTHALLQQDVVFKNATLVVIDEQHRFGVLQRARLFSKGAADTLVMTATPIPRTLALTVYGDLDVSIIDELPPGRVPVETRHVSESCAFDILLHEIRSGGQAYVVYPLIDESDKVSLRSVIKEWERLKRSIFSTCRVGLLHGRMKHTEKDSVMHAFADGSLDVLMSTTVIEVGIDVPNATVMMIQHAERFGLATLHQLRGRVGRGSRTSLCLLVGEPTTGTAYERLRILQNVSDGFRIGEEDLRLRGPGEFMGISQHGLPSLKAGNLLTDSGIILAAREDAQSMVKDFANEEPREINRLKHVLHKRFGEAAKLVHIG